MKMKLKFNLAILAYTTFHFKKTSNAFVFLPIQVPFKDYCARFDRIQFRITDGAIHQIATKSRIGDSAALSAIKTSSYEDNSHFFLNEESENVDASENQEESLNEMILNKFQTYYPRTPQQKLLTFTLHEFQPLGLTAEESLAQKDTTGKYHHVFVSKVVESGFADKAGIKVGDVIVGLTGLFGTSECVVGESLEKVKGMILSQKKMNDSNDLSHTPSGKGLVIKVIRGSLVMNDHESEIVNLCTLPDNETKIEQCLEALYQRDYEMNTSNVEDKVSNEQCDDIETECMLDTLFSSWDDFDVKENLVDSDPAKEEIQKPAPWSSRSSPSGTFVRDPKTGKLINIDE